jgi:hypothetical protein
MNRRDWLTKSVGSMTLATASIAAIQIPQASASAATTDHTLSLQKQALLHAIETKAPEEEILQCIERLVTATKNTDQYTSTRSSSSSSVSLLDSIDGRWKLIWSVGAQQFSPLLQLPFPLTPDSFQLAGTAAASVVGEGRIAQLLTSGILGPTQLYLSSGIVDYNDYDGDRSLVSVLQIQPPFRLQVELPVTHQRLTLVEAGTDADFRAVNARSVQAQQAPPNLYQQLYVDDQLRISKIVKGDPVIVGATFVHIKVQQ